MTSAAAGPPDDDVPADRAAASMSPPPPLFRILKTAASSVAGSSSAAGAVEDTLARTAAPRLGSLALPGRTPVATPAFFAVTSRGAVPHVTPDNGARYGLVDGAYFALEDFVENIPLVPGRRPPIYSTPASPPASASSLASSPASSSASPSASSAAAPPLPRLHAFAALAPSTVSVLAPRRHPAAASHLGNGPGHISIVTSTGFQKLTLDAYHAAVDTLRPDIAVPLADLTFGAGTSTSTADKGLHAPAAVPYPSAKRAVRMAERTEDWMDKLYRDGVAEATGAALFAPTLPVPYATQWQYLNRLAELADEAAIAGLAVYDVDLLPDLHADYADSALAPLPRLSLHPAVTPHHVLRQVALGADVLLLPAITDASEQGLAYTFAWPAGAEGEGEGEGEGDQKPLAVDLTDPAHKAAVAPLAPNCTCAACAAHHRAYVHHLLDAREMLAWTLLQVHNHHVVAAFFAGIRQTLAAEGVAGFRARARRFQAAYEPELPAGQATRPRARGYQVKSDGVVDAPLNKPAWGRLEEVAPGRGGDGQ